MHPTAQRTHEEGQLLFLPSIFNETLELLFDAHRYFESYAAIDQSIIPSSARGDYASEMTRITLRLTSIMAWIMVRRAVYAGRIEAETAGEQYRLEAADVCREHRREALAVLPQPMGYLADHSHALFERVFRLDRMAYGERA